MAYILFVGWPLVACLLLSIGLYLLYGIVGLTRLWRRTAGSERLLASLLLLHLCEPLVNAPLLTMLFLRSVSYGYMPHRSVIVAAFFTVPVCILLLPYGLLLGGYRRHRALLWGLSWRGGVRIFCVFGIFYLLGSGHFPWDIVIFTVGYIFLFYTAHWAITAEASGWHAT